MMERLFNVYKAMKSLNDKDASHPASTRSTIRANYFLLAFRLAGWALLFSFKRIEGPYLKTRPLGLESTGSQDETLGVMSLDEQSQRHLRQNIYSQLS